MRNPGLSARSPAHRPPRVPSAFLYSPAHQPPRIPSAFLYSPAHQPPRIPSASSPGLFGAAVLHDLKESAGIEAGAAHEGAIDVRLAHQGYGILRFDAAAVLDAH